MAGLVPSKKKKTEPAGNGGALAPYHSFPTFVRRMQSEFDEFFDQFARGWPAPWKGFETGLGRQSADPRAFVVSPRSAVSAGSVTGFNPHSATTWGITLGGGSERSRS